MQTRRKQLITPASLIPRTKKEIAAVKKKKEDEVAAERQQKEARQEEQREKRTASQKRVSEFEDKLAVEQKTKQTLRPDRLLAASSPTQQTSGKDSRVVEGAPPLANTSSPTENIADPWTDATHPAANSPATIDEPMADDTGAEVDDIDLSLLPVDDANGPPTSESEGGFALGNFDNSSTDAFSMTNDDIGFGGEDQNEEDGEDEIQDFGEDIDMAGSSDEYKEEDGEDEEDEEDDYEEVDPGKKRKNSSTTENARQPQAKKSRKKSSAPADDSEGENDKLFLEFLQYKKALKAREKKAEKAKTKRSDTKAKKSAVRESTHLMRTVQPAKPKVAPKSKTASKNESGSTGKKTNEIGGIKKNWRSGIYTMTGAASSTASIAKSAGSGVEEEPGAFDQDESHASQAAARLAQATSGGSRRREVKEEDDVQLVPADVAEIDVKERGSASSSRKYYARRDLPVTSPSQLDTWDKDVVPFILAWVGNLEDTFNANAAEGFRAEVAKRWVAAFPKLPRVVEFKEKKMVRQEHPAIYAVAFQTVRTWRSETGKDAFEALSNLFNDDLMLKQWGTIAKRREFVGLYLQKNNFAYEDFSGEQRTGSFRGPMLLQSFCYHVRYLVRIVGKDLASKTEYFQQNGYPVGALALSFVAVKRALKLWENGYLAGDDVEKSSKKPNKKPRTTPTGFNNDPWGKEAKVKVVPLIRQLKPHQWAEIFQKCEALLASQGQSDDLEDDEMAAGDGDGDAGLGEDEEPEMTISD